MLNEFAEIRKISDESLSGDETPRRNAASYQPRNLNSSYPKSANNCSIKFGTVVYLEIKAKIYWFLTFQNDWKFMWQKQVGSQMACALFVNLVELKFECEAGQSAERKLPSSIIKERLPNKGYSTLVRKIEKRSMQV